MSAVLHFEGVSKRYRIGMARRTLRDALSALPTRWAGHGGAGASDEYFWALEDVSFEVTEGRVLGIIGPNGAGKTTVLKLISGITKPTVGRLQVRGRVSALIELGAGFHPDLTGRENVYLNGLILGLSRKEISRQFDRIVAFAELERFIETPVKHYSSGMYARLGFAVAAHAAPDLLLVDEVLSVGDASFQRKCHDFVDAFVRSRHTAVFVSHNLYMMENLCTDLLWLDGGRIVMWGPPAEVLPAYLDRAEEQALRSHRPRQSAEGSLDIVSVSLTDGAGKERETFDAGEDIVVQLRYTAAPFVERPHFNIGVLDPRSGTPLFVASMLVDGDAPPRLAGDGVVCCRFRSVPLMPQVYDLWGEVWAADRTQHLVKWQRMATFRIASPTESQQRDLGKGGITRLRAGAPIHVPYKWEY
jgi:lipopolysaccharide transport system ATP-binding protein